MKKLIIISGQPGSGKSWITRAIIMQHDKNDILYLSFNRKSLNNIRDTHKLILCEEVYRKSNDEIKEFYNAIIEKAPNASVVFHTQQFVRHEDVHHFAHTINTDFKGYY